MQFVKETRAEAIPKIAGSISDALERGDTVLWLVCGGSNIPLQTIIMEDVRTKTAHLLDKLEILLMDERYGRPGHIDSNYHQLSDSGFNPGKAKWVDILAENLPLPQTVERYSSLLRRAHARNSYIIATFGLGADGHTAGILPHSPAVIDTEAAVIGYRGDEHIRLTLAPSELFKIDEAYVLAYGENKAEALKRLAANKESMTDLPGKLFYSLSNVTVYNDTLG